MKIATSNGKRTVKISKSEWENIGKNFGWLKHADEQTIQWERPQQLRGIADAVETLCQKLETRVSDEDLLRDIHRVKGYTQQLRIIAKELG